MMMWILLSVAFGSSMLESSRGIIGRDAKTILLADQAYQCVAEERWSDCAPLWKKRAELRDASRNDALMWALICHMNAEQFSEAYLVLGDLILVVEEIGWPLLLVEGWLLQELGGNKETIKLLEDYPPEEADYIGAQILQLRASQTISKRRKTKKVKERVLLSGKADAWFWQEMANFATSEEKTIFLERAIHSQFASHYQYIQLVNLYEEEENFHLALRCGLDGLNSLHEPNQLTYRMLLFASSQDGRRALLEKVQNIPEHAKAQALLGLSFFAEEEYEKSIEHLSLAIQYGETQIGMYDRLLDAYRHIGAQDQVWLVLDAAVVAHPDDERLWESFYEASVSEEQKEGFLNALNQAWKKGEQRSVHLTSRAFNLSRSLQDNESALLWAEREIDVSESSWKTLSRYALALSAVNRRTEAISLYERALQLDPDNSFVLNNLAWLLITPAEGAKAEPQRAYVLIQEAIHHSPKPVAGYYDTLAAVLWSMGRRAEAIKAQKQAIEVDPTEEKYQERYRKYENSAQ